MYTTCNLYRVCYEGRNKFRITESGTLATFDAQAETILVALQRLTLAYIAYTATAGHAELPYIRYCFTTNNANFHHIAPLGLPTPRSTRWSEQGL
jgi:hypothetical protein